MAFSKKNDDIKKRAKANDVFITPRDLALKHIQMIDYDDGDSWLDPCCYDPETGSYISQFPNDNKDWCEISKGVDFFEYNKAPDHICSNPPYSMMDTWLKKCIELEPKTISFLIGIGNLTAKRIEFMSKAGYELEKMNMMKVYEWFGMSVAVVFRKGAKPLFDIDRKVYRVVEKPKPKKIYAYKVKTSSDEEEPEQCVGLYDGKCCGKKNYKTEELDLGMCKACYDKMEEDAGGQVEYIEYIGKAYCEVGEHFVEPDDMWDDFADCKGCVSEKDYKEAKEEEVFDNDKLKKYNS